jgi:hypothetical protein
MWWNGKSFMSVVLDCLEKAIQIVADTLIWKDVTFESLFGVLCFVVIRYDAHSWNISEIAGTMLCHLAVHAFQTCTLLHDITWSFDIIFMHFLNYCISVLYIISISASSFFNMSSIAVRLAQVTVELYNIIAMHRPARCNLNWMLTCNSYNSYFDFMKFWVHIYVTRSAIVTEDPKIVP